MPLCRAVRNAFSARQHLHDIDTMAIEPSQISERERDILRLVATGATNQQIAQQLHISVNTVKVHLRNIFAKIGATSRTEATLYAVRSGLVQVAQEQPTPLAVVEAAPSPISEPVLDEPAPPASVGEPATASADTPVSLAPVALAPLPPATEPAVVAVPAPAAPTPVPRRRLLIAGGVVIVALIGLIVALLLRPAPTASPTTLPTAGPPTTTDTWRELTPMPIGRAGFALVGVSNEGRVQLFALAGETSTGVSGDSLRYNADNGTWQPLSPKPTAVTDIHAVRIGNTIIIPGGRTADNKATTVNEAFDIRSGTWSTLAPLPEPRSAYALASANGKLFLFGGWDGTVYTNDVWEYNPDTNTWSKRSAMPTARAFAAAVVASDESIYVIGGENASGSLATNERYSPAEEGSGTPWQAKTALPRPISHADAAAATSSLYLLGGDDSANQLLVYSPEANAWEQQVFPLTAVRDLRVQLVNNTIYVLGGRDASSLREQTYAYQAIYNVSLPLMRN